MRSTYLWTGDVSVYLPVDGRVPVGPGDAGCGGAEGLAVEVGALSGCHADGGGSLQDAEGHCTQNAHAKHG